MRFRLDDLEYAVKLKIMDTALALVDRVRFELMRRLGWVEGVPGGERPIIQLVQEAWRRQVEFAREIPRLAADHPDYQAYARLNHLGPGGVHPEAHPPGRGHLPGTAGGRESGLTGNLASGAGCRVLCRGFFQGAAEFSCGTILFFFNKKNFPRQ